MFGLNWPYDQANLGWVWLVKLLFRPLVCCRGHGGGGSERLECVPHNNFGSQRENLASVGPQIAAYTTGLSAADGAGGGGATKVIKDRARGERREREAWEREVNPKGTVQHCILCLVVSFVADIPRRFDTKGTHWVSTGLSSTMK